MSRIFEPSTALFLIFALSTALYLSYALACRVFLSFQWDNLLLECGLLAAFLPADRAAPVVHFVFRALLFKLYFESGIAKWQSPLRDWHDGSAMTTMDAINRHGGEAAGVMENYRRASDQMRRALVAFLDSL